MKKSLLKVLAVAGVLSVASLVVMAQKPNHDPAARIQHHVDFLTKKLSLTPAQQAQATTIFTNAASNQQATREQMKTAHQNLQAAVQKNDAAGIDQAAASIGNMTSQMIAARAKTQAAFFQTLTPEQQTKMTEMKGRMHGRGGWGRRGHGGPDGPMGHGGPPPGDE